MEECEGGIDGGARMEGWRVKGSWMGMVKGQVVVDGGDMRVRVHWWMGECLVRGG